jgi:ankyrin repeat protein
MSKRFLLFGLAFALLAVAAAGIYTAKSLKMWAVTTEPRPHVYVQSPLEAAILRRDATGVETLLAAGTDPTVRIDRDSAGSTIPNVHGLTPLMLAAFGGDLSVYWDFYEYPGMEPRSQGRWDKSAIVESLLHYGADPNAADEHGWTPLLCATINNNLSIAQSLLDHGADVNEKLQGGGRVLMDASHRDETSLVGLFLSKGAQVNTQNATGWSALDAACDADTGVDVSGKLYPRGSAAVVQLLLNHGADINLPCRGTYSTALMIAVSNLNTAVVQSLLKGGADVNARNPSGLTPLMVVPRTEWTANGLKSSLPILGMLLIHGARVDMQSNDGNTPLTRAAQKGDVAAAWLLIKYGADVNAVNRARHIALWFVVNNGDKPLQRLLLSHGAKRKTAQSTSLPKWAAGIANWNIHPHL